MNYKEKLFSSVEMFFYRAFISLHQKHRFYQLYWLLKGAMPDITPFRNRHKGQRCFILGGGPSLLKIDPAPLRNEITFGVNGVFLIFAWLGFQPTYYTVEDTLVYEDRFHDIKKYVTESVCFFPIQFSTADFDRDNHRYFRAIYEFEEHPDWPSFSNNAGKLIWIGGTVIYVCIQLAFYMGFQTVYLLGMDHNYAKPEHVVTKGTEWTSMGDDPNHFHPNYFGKGKRWHDPRVDRMEKAYLRAHREFRNAGRNILNATVGGKLDIFDRINYEKIFTSE